MLLHLETPTVSVNESTGKVQDGGEEAASSSLFWKSAHHKEEITGQVLRSIFQ